MIWIKRVITTELRRIYVDENFWPSTLKVMTITKSQLCSFESRWNLLKEIAFIASASPKTVHDFTAPSGVKKISGVKSVIYNWLLFAGGASAVPAKLTFHGLVRIDYCLAWGGNTLSFSNSKNNR